MQHSKKSFHIYCSNFSYPLDKSLSEVEHLPAAKIEDAMVLLVKELRTDNPVVHPKPQPFAHSMVKRSIEPKPITLGDPDKSQSEQQGNKWDAILAALNNIIRRALS